MTGSWKTTLCGILSILAAIITFVALPLLDGNPETSTNVTALIAAIVAGIGLIKARDNDKSSEDVGAK